MKTKKVISIFLSLVIILGTVVFAIPVNAATPDFSINEKGKEPIAQLSSFKAYDSYLENVMNTANISGVAYVTQDGRVIAQHAKGMKNTAENKEMTIDTLFPIGSVSKQFCATTVLLLQEQGKLSVHDTLDKYFPEYEIGKDITVKNLLSMRSGIRDHVNPDEYYIGYEIPTNQYTLYNTNTAKENTKIITDWLFTQELKFAPGTQFAYSNANFLLLSLIVEQASGMKYSDFVKQNIFTPLEMTHSGFYEELVDSPDLAEHSFPDGIEPSDPDYHGLSQGAGDLVSNAEDMDKWLTSLRERTLLSEESYNEMTTDYGEGYCYGIETQNGSLYHQGNIATYETFVLTNPEKNLNIFVVTNDVSTVYEKNYSMSVFGFAILNKLNVKTKLGDVDSDGEVSILDATAIQMHFAQIKQLTNKQIRYGDTDGDGDVSILDATEIQLHLAQK